MTSPCILFHAETETLITFSRTSSPKVSVSRWPVIVNAHIGKGPVKMRFVVEIDTETISLLTLRFPHFNLFHLCTTFVTVFTILLSERNASEAWKPCNKSILFQKSIELERKAASSHNCFILYVRTYREWCWIQFIKPILHKLKCKHNRYTISYTHRQFLVPSEMSKHVGNFVPIVFKF
jgi:hypothetical protein